MVPSNTPSLPMRYAVFGGTFDPPHLAHTMVCLWALETGEIDTIIVVPVARHAFGKEPAADFSHRFTMCTLAMERLMPEVLVSDIENRREGTSYMVDTLRHLQEEYPNGTFRLLIGTDVARELPNWKSVEEVTRLAPPLEVPRVLPGEPAKPGALPLISSTDIRRTLLQNEKTERLLSAAVRDYIIQHNLYTQE